MKMEFSKALLIVMMATYILGVIIGAIIVIRNPSQLTAYLGYIAAPTTTAIGFYKWKAKNENVSKYGNDDNE